MAENPRMASSTRRCCLCFESTLKDGRHQLDMAGDRQHARPAFSNAAIRPTVEHAGGIHCNTHHCEVVRANG